MGLAVAYNLAKHHGITDVVVLEASYLCSGASGRNGGGVRAQWSSEANIRLMQESLALCREFAGEHRINTWFRQGGYLFLVRDEERRKSLEQSVELQNRCGVKTRLVAPKNLAEIVPEISSEGVIAASYNGDDAVVFPWPFVWGYAGQAVSRGVTVRTHTAVDRIEGLADGLRLHLSTSERLDADRVLNATGAWSIELNRSLGIELPNHPHRHEIMSSEPLKPFLDPLVVDLATGLYFSQSTRGEIVAGITMPDEGPPATEVDLASSRRFLAHLGRALTTIMPLTAQLRVLRQWSGPYDVSPDGDAIVGPSPGLPRLYQVCGFTGHGFMMAPAVGKLLARLLAKGERHPMLERWDPARFSRGGSTRREDMIIG